MKLTMERLARMRDENISMTMKKAIMRRLGELAMEGKRRDERTGSTRLSLCKIGDSYNNGPTTPSTKPRSE